jgi:ABC-type multidrug transport system fused ATPase/permease subunit
MKQFFKFILRLIYPYKWFATAYVVFSVLSQVFAVFSMVMIMPFLQVLFNQDHKQYVFQAWKFSPAVLQNNFYYYLKVLVNSGGAIKALTLVCVFVLLGTFLKSLFGYLGSHFLVPMRNGILTDMRNTLFSKILKLPISYFSESRKGDIMARVTGDVNEIEFSIISSVEMLTKEPITIAVYISTLIFMSPSLTLFILILLPISGTIIGMIGKNLKRMSMKGQVKLGELTSTLEEALTGMRIIKAFNAEKRVDGTYRRQNNEFKRIAIRINRKRALASPISEFLGISVLVVVLWYGCKLVLGKTMEPDTLIAYIALFSQVINPAKNFAQAWYGMQKGRASIERIKVILNADERISDKPDARNVVSFERDIEFKNVSFAYENEYVIKSVNLKISKGKSIALVGQSGSGKSTLVDLIPRFYDIVEGDILIDGVSIKDVKVKSLRSLMGNVNQESILFNDTIFNNIAFGLETATLEDVQAAAKVANAHDFIMATEKGYETNIGDRGSKLSGGQRQRISIARAVLKNPPIMILDEATSALDTESEYLVQEALYNLMRNRTSIIIAHRLSTIKHADEICVLHEGEIVERGKHDELLELRGYYKKLYDLQMF